MKATIRTASALTGLALLALLMGCRGQTSEQPPLYIKHGMEYQPKWLGFGNNQFTADGRNMQAPPEGTVPVGMLKSDPVYWRGGQDTAHLAAHNPMKIDARLMERGQERFQIYCTPCHGGTGTGNGIVVQKGFLPPPSFHDARIVGVQDGYIFNVISHGVRNMPSYGKQITEEDRWAIVAYVRALQRTQRATINDVPESERANLR